MKTQREISEKEKYYHYEKFMTNIEKKKEFFIEDRFKRKVAKFIFSNEKKYIIAKVGPPPKYNLYSCAEYSKKYGSFLAVEHAKKFLTKRPDVLTETELREVEERNLLYICEYEVRKRSLKHKISEIIKGNEEIDTSQLFPVKGLRLIETNDLRLDVARLVYNRMLSIKEIKVFDLEPICRKIVQ